MYRVFLSHSRRDNSAAQALFQWLTEAEPSLKGEIFLDVTPRTGLRRGCAGSPNWLARWIAAKR